MSSIRFLSIPVLCLLAADSLSAQRTHDFGSRNIAEETRHLTPQLLVPGFGRKSETEPLPGFGAALERRSTSVSEVDERAAANQLLKYDRNRDGFLTKEELPVQVADKAKEIDRNHDGKLSARELAVQFGIQRVKRSGHTGNSQFASQTPPVKEAPDLFNGRRSYRDIGSRRLPDGLPSFFGKRDANGDGQITMAEFTTVWSDEVIAIFIELDFNLDGIITPQEALQLIEVTPIAASSLSDPFAPD